MTDTNIGADRGTAIRSDAATAIDAPDRSVQSPAEKEAAVLQLIDTAGRSNRQAIIDELAALPLDAFGTLESIRATLALAERGERFEELAAKFRAMLEPGAPVPHWTGDDRLKRYKIKSSFDIVNLIALLKYAQGPKRFEGFADAVRYYAPRFELPDAIVDVLYDRSVSPPSDKAAFADRLKEGFIVDHIINDLVRRRGRNKGVLPEIELGYKDLWADGALQDPSGADPDRRKTTVFLTCHNGMLDHIKFWYKTVFTDGIRMGSGASDKIASSRDNPNAALLEAYRAAMGGKPLLIAADSPMGTAKNTLTVFGQTMQVADGFVFLSFESRADVYFAIIVPENGRMVLRAVRGPSREDGEKIAAYRPRLLRFVEEQMEAYLSSPPEQIGLRRKWINVLAGAKAGDDDGSGDDEE